MNNKKPKKCSDCEHKSNDLYCLDYCVNGCTIFVKVILNRYKMLYLIVIKKKHSKLLTTYHLPHFPEQ